MRVTPRSVLFAPSTRGVLLPTRRQTGVIASHMDIREEEKRLVYHVLALSLGAADAGSSDRRCQGRYRRTARVALLNHLHGGASLGILHMSPSSLSRISLPIQCGIGELILRVGAGATGSAMAAHVNNPGERHHLILMDDMSQLSICTLGEIELFYEGHASICCCYRYIKKIMLILFQFHIRTDLLPILDRYFQIYIAMRDSRQDSNTMQVILTPPSGTGRWISTHIYLYMQLYNSC
jgi:hypothetical protein